MTVLNYNYARFLPGCLDSIIAQTMQDFELIVIDDCSTDGSLSVIQPYRHDPRVRVIEHTANAGYVRSLLEGTEASVGDYLTVISADDVVLRRDAFEKQLALLDAHPDAGYCFSAFEKHYTDGSQATARHASFEADRVLGGEEMMRYLLVDNNVQVLHSGAMIRRAAYERAGGYSRALRFAPDTDLWLRLCLAGDAAYVASPLYGYGIHASQMSGTGAHREQMIETISVLERACDAAARAGKRGVALLRREAVQAYLFGAAMDEAFRGQRGNALRRCAVAVRLRPLATATSRFLWIVVLRVALGDRGFKLARSTGRAVSAPLR